MICSLYFSFQLNLNPQRLASYWSLICMVLDATCACWFFVFKKWDYATDYYSTNPFLFFYYCLFYYSCPNFPPLPSSTQPTPCSYSQSPHRCPCPGVIHTCSLTNPFPFFPPVLPSPASELSVYSISLVPFCLLVYFVPLIGEIIWYLSSTY